MNLFDAIRQWHGRRMTIRQLRQLDDHLLRDIGIRRDEIRFVADRMAKSLPASDRKGEPTADLGIVKSFAVRRPHGRNAAGRRSAPNDTFARSGPLDHRPLPARRRQVDGQPTGQRHENPTPKIKECC